MSPVIAARMPFMHHRRHKFTRRRAKRIGKRHDGGIAAGTLSWSLMVRHIVVEWAILLTWAALFVNYGQVSRRQRKWRAGYSMNLD